MPARLLVLVVLALVAIAPELEAQDAKKAKGPMTYAEAEADLRKTVDRWLDGRRWTKLIERGEKTGVRPKPGALAKVTWDVLPLAVREGQNRDRFLATFSQFDVPRWGGDLLAHDGARVERVELSRDLAAVAVRSTAVAGGDQDQAGRIQITRGEERTEEPTTWIRQAGRWVLCLRLEGVTLRPTPVSEQLFADPWFLDGSVSLRAVDDRMRLVDAASDATQLERSRMAEAAAAELEGKTVADMGAIENVLENGMAMIRIGPESYGRTVYAWVPRERIERLTGMRVGTRVRFRGTVSLGRWAVEAMGHVELQDAEVEPLER